MYHISVTFFILECIKVGKYCIDMCMTFGMSTCECMMSTLLIYENYMYMMYMYMYVCMYVCMYLSLSM